MTELSPDTSHWAILPELDSRVDQYHRNPFLDMHKPNHNIGLLRTRKARSGTGSSQ